MHGAVVAAFRYLRHAIQRLAEEAGILTTADQWRIEQLEKRLRLIEEGRTGD